MDVADLLYNLLHNKSK